MRGVGNWHTGTELLRARACAESRSESESVGTFCTQHRGGIVGRMRCTRTDGALPPVLPALHRGGSRAVRSRLARAATAIAASRTRSTAPRGPAGCTICPATRTRQRFASGVFRARRSARLPLLATAGWLGMLAGCTSTAKIESFKAEHREFVRDATYLPLVSLTGTTLPEGSIDGEPG